MYKMNIYVAAHHVTLADNVRQGYYLVTRHHAAMMGNVATLMIFSYAPVFCPTMVR